MASAIGQQITVHECLVNTPSDGWVKGQCYRDVMNDGYYLVRLEPIPPNMRKGYLENGGHPLFGTIAMLSIDKDSPDFRLILSSEVTVA